jgi:amino acid transporter
MIMGWLASLILLAGTYSLGYRRREAFIFLFVGELLWALVGINRSEWDLVFVCICFALLMVRNFIKWKEDDEESAFEHRKKKVHIDVEENN